MSEIYRPTVAVIDLDHLAYNFKLAQKHAPGKTIIPVIKANAYGHGVIDVMRHLYDQGSRICAVSLLEEALEVRKVFDDIDILMMGPAFKNDLTTCSKARIMTTVYDQESLRDVLKAGVPLSIHLKVDTGMRRYGLSQTEEIMKALKSLHEASHVDLSGLYTHLSTADTDESYMQGQIERFKAILELSPVVPRMVHVANSSAIFKVESTFDFTTHARLGISLYGLSLDHPKPDLRPVMSLMSVVGSIRHLNKGDVLGYGATYQATRDETIAVIPIGYADGFIRRNRDSDVEIKGHRYPLVGTICMDACFARVSDGIQKGDPVTLFGGLITTDEVANRLGTIHYEVTTGISSRVPRITKKGLRT